MRTYRDFLFSGFAPAAYQLATAFKKRGKIVVGGGPHVTYCKEEALTYFDTIVVGEAESVWEELLTDHKLGQLRNVYQGAPCDMRSLPTPRYDLLKQNFFVPRVIQATRGCPFKCSFCYSTHFESWISIETYRGCYLKIFNTMTFPTGGREKWFGFGMIT